MKFSKRLITLQNLIFFKGDRSIFFFFATNEEKNIEIYQQKKNVIEKKFLINLIVKKIHCRKKEEKITCQKHFFVEDLKLRRRVLMQIGIKKV